MNFLGLVQLGSMFRLAGRRGGYNRSHMTQASVIIPTRNRAELLDKCLKSLCNQALAKDQFEVIVVNNGSTDHTKEVVRRFTDVLPVQCIDAMTPGLHVGRHAGMRRATSDILMFADDDIRVAPTWVGSVVRAFEDPRVGVAGGNNYPEFESEPPPWLRMWWEMPVGRGKALGYLSILDFGDADGPIDPSYIWGCNFAVRAAALTQVGGFHPDGMPSELVLRRGDGESYVANAVVAAGWEARFVAGASVWHRVSASRMTKEYFEQRGYAQGISDSYARIRGRRALSSDLAVRASTAARCWLRALRRGALPGQLGFSRRVRADVMRAASRSWRRGVLEHHAACRRDPALLAWVLRENYLSES